MRQMAGSIGPARWDFYDPSFPATLRGGSQTGLERLLNFLVLAYVALLPYQIQVSRQMRVAPADLVLFAIALLVPGALRLPRYAWGVWHLALLMVFAVGTFMTALHSGQLSRYVVLNKDIGLLLLFFTYVVIVSAATDWERVRTILRVFVISVVFQNVIAVAAFFITYFFAIETPFTRYGGTRLSGMLIDANAYGGLLCMTLAICEGASFGPRPLFRGLPLFFCRLTLSMGILLTFSRSAWLGLLVALLWLCIVRPKAAVWLVSAGLAGVSAALLFRGSRFLELLANMASRPEQVTGRLALIHESLADFARHPFWGGGIGNFQEVQGVIPHNTALWFLADMGMVGLIVLLGYLGWFLVKGVDAYRWAGAGNKPVLLGLLLANISMFGLAMGIEAFYQRHWWVIQALIAASYCIARRQTRSRWRQRQRTASHVAPSRAAALQPVRAVSQESQ